MRTNKRSAIIKRAMDTGTVCNFGKVQTAVEFKTTMQVLDELLKKLERAAEQMRHFSINISSLLGVRREA